jgi:formylglycine-generating enzyme required for sulfatase activity
MEVNPSVCRGDRRPVENVSWDDITGPGRFLEKINGSELRAELARQTPDLANPRFRLPSEAEWEYAARGGEHWTDGFQFSGSNEVNAVAWYKDKSGDQMHQVAQKAPNQLGLYDMSGNAWEWCQDCYVEEVGQIPDDGSQRIAGGKCFGKEVPC